MSLTTYTVFSIVVLIGFIVANVHYGLPWYASLGLLYGLVMCIKGLTI
jgi:uncharacterized membrane protein